MTRPLMTIALITFAACNEAPEGLELSLAPAAPATTDDLVLTVDVTDPDGDALITSIEWTADGTEMPDLSGESTVPAAQTAKGQVWEATVTVSDGKETTDPATASVTVVNTAPTAESAVISPNPATTLTVLSVTWDEADLDGDTLTATFDWSIAGTSVGDGETLQSGIAQKGDTVLVEVTVDDGEATASTTAQIDIDNVPPGPPTIQLRPVDIVNPSNDDLRCTITGDGFDVDADDLSYEIEWLVDGAEWTGRTSTTTHPDDTIARADLVSGQSWVCRARSDDGDDVSDWVSSAAVQVVACRSETVTLIATDSACNSEPNGNTWMDNRVRAYNYPTSNQDIVGWMKFDLSRVPSTAEVTKATMRLHEEWGRTYQNPEMVFVESDDNDWTRSTITGDSPPKGEEISESYTSFTIDGWNTFEIDPLLWDWGADIDAGTATIGIDNIAERYSYVYFHGPTATGMEPELELTYEVCD